MPGACTDVLTNEQPFDFGGQGSLRRSTRPPEAPLSPSCESTEDKLVWAMPGLMIMHSLIFSKEISLEQTDLRRSLEGLLGSRTAHLMDISDSARMGLNACFT